MSRNTGRSPVSKAASRSPVPLNLRNPPVPTFAVDSPASSASMSPSPRKRVVPSPKRKPRRRRESGLLRPPQPSQGTRAQEQESLDDGSQSLGPGKNDEYHPDLPQEENELEVMATHDRSGNFSTGDNMTITVVSPEPTDRLSAGTSTSSSNDTTRRYDLSELLSPGSAAAAILAEEDSKRGRRARSSVNYKEPSLTK